ncbi:MAG: cupredoxin domain-containing protein [Pseudomonadota bacterium]
MTIIFNLIAVLLIGLIILWFWLIKPKEEKMQADKIEIKVKDGIYTPAIIRTKVGETITLNFLREDPTPFASVVMFPDFDKSIELPVGQIKPIKLKLTQAGEFNFSCEMNMYRGKLIVE